jgi:hypothetical protein
MQEITGQDPGCLGGQEPAPGRRRAPRRGPQARQQPGSGGSSLPRPVPQAKQLALNLPIAPRGFCRASFPPACGPRLAPAITPSRADRSTSF